MRSLLWVAAWCLCGVAGWSGENFVELSFSDDGGKTWSADFPLLKDGARAFKAKAAFRLDEPRDIDRNVVTGNLHSTETDFASANRGRQYWLNGNKDAAWFQNLPVYWKNARQPGEFVYDIDLGARPEGAVGMQNRWDKEAGKFVDAPLPAAPALAPGVYRFVLGLTYTIKEPREPVRIEKPFDVVIE